MLLSSYPALRRDPSRVGHYSSLCPIVELHRCCGWCHFIYSAAVAGYHSEAIPSPIGSLLAGLGLRRGVWGWMAMVGVMVIVTVAAISHHGSMVLLIDLILRVGLV